MPASRPAQKNVARSAFSATLGAQRRLPSSEREGPRLTGTPRPLRTEGDERLRSLTRAAPPGSCFRLWEERNALIIGPAVWLGWGTRPDPVRGAYRSGSGQPTLYTQINAEASSPFAFHL